MVKTTKLWTKERLDKLKEIHEKNKDKYVIWKDHVIPGLTEEQCRSKYKSIYNKDSKKPTFTEKQSKLIIEKLKGITNKKKKKEAYNELANITNKTVKQIKRKYNNELNPILSKWTTEEDELMEKLLQKQEQYTQKELAIHFPTHSKVAIQNSYRRIKKKVEQGWTSEEDNYILSKVKNNKLYDKDADENGFEEKIKLSGRHIKSILSRYNYLINKQ